MIESGKTAGTLPPLYDLDYQFKFNCHAEVSCFTKCCRGIQIILTPYDIIRLKNRLKLRSDEFLALYTQPRMLEKTDLPVVSLKLLDDELASCPFVGKEGCSIYADRPTTCRYYPLGVASLSHCEGVQGQGFYFFIHEPHCLGFNEEKVWSIREWRRAQGVERHDDINAEWTDLVVRKRSFPASFKLTEQSKQMFFMVNYDIDRFRRFVFESSFLKRYDVDPDTLAKIMHEDISLLKFGFRWLRWILFKDGRSEFRASPASRKTTQEKGALD